MLYTEILNGREYAFNLLFLIVGILFLVKGADYFVASASAIARKLKIPPIIIGLTVVSFGTSAPELAVAIAASLKGDSGLALSNVVGSNIFNILFICGISGLITPLTISNDILTDMVISLVLTVLVLWFSKKGKLGRGQGCILLLCYILYLMYIGLRLFYSMLVLPV